MSLMPIGNSMPRLLQINVTANWGSTGRIAESIGQCVLRHGWESYIAYGRYSRSSQSQLVRIGTALDPYCHYGEQRIFDNEGLCSRRATEKFIATLRTLSPDVVHLHNIHDHYLNYKLLFEYLNSTSIQVVWTFHDCWAFTGHCFHFVTCGCTKWQHGCSLCPLCHSYPNTLLDGSERNYNLKQSLFTANPRLTIVPCSDWMASLVKSSFLKDKKIHTIHNGVDLKVFSPSSSSVKADDAPFTVLAVSSVWSREKGLYDIYQLRQLLPSSYKMLVVGLSPKQIKRLPAGIVGIPRTHDVQQLVSLYHQADVLINPTYADTFPTVNLEALACGTPVITYDTGGSPEAVDAQTGIVVPQGDVQALSAAILRLKEHPLSSVACRQRAEALFDKDKCFDSYIQLYHQLLSSSPCSSAD